MKNRSITFVLAFAAIAFASCNKSNNNNQTKDNLIGTWTAATNATDNNGNGIMDANETFPDTRYVMYDLAFSADGKLTYLNNHIVAGIANWELTTDNSYLRIFETTNSLSYHIDAITASVLTVKDTSGGRISWVVFNKK